MLSLTCKTAIKAVIYLASKYDAGINIGIKEMVGCVGGNEHSVGKLLQTLVRNNIINSVKGPSGGFYISKDQLKQPLIHIVEAIDGDEVFRECGLGLNKYSVVHTCPIHDDYKLARDMLENIFKKKRSLTYMLT